MKTEDHEYKLRSYKLQHQIEKEKFFYEVGRWTTIRLALMEYYFSEVKEKRCCEIEQLPSKEKKELWNMAVQYRRQGEQDQEYLKELCRAFHGFQVYLKLNK